MAAAMLWDKYIQTGFVDKQLKLEQKPFQYI